MKSQINILVGCEESQAVTIELRKLGYNAFSCDLLPCSGGHPEWHIQGDIFKAINPENGFIKTSTGHFPIKEWNAMIAFPTCTYLTNAGIGYFNEDKYGDKARIRKVKRLEAAEFFMRLYNCQIPCVALENPVGWMNSSFRKPDQILRPYYFGEPHQKNICLWLRGLPLITWDKEKAVKPEPIEIQYRKPSKYYQGGEEKKRYITDTTKKNSIVRSKTFVNMAKAMAEQWSTYLNDTNI